MISHWSQDPELRRWNAAFRSASEPQERAAIAEKIIDRACALDGMSRNDRRKLIAAAKLEAREEQRQSLLDPLQSLIETFRR